MVHISKNVVYIDSAGIIQ